MREHQLHGTESVSVHARPSVAMQTATGNLPAPPDDLDADALELWTLVATTRTAWLSESDAPALKSLCECWSLRQRAYAALADDATDKLARCAFTAYQQCFDRLAARFGLTPSDRARLGEKTEDAFDPAAKYLA
ncbi:MAG: hypothetical protein CMJ58_17715 [Planctomycetaceae bacterium]|nr:hypothetical protein [Planctomycetaceae bacterium]